MKNFIIIFLGALLTACISLSDQEYWLNFSERKECRYEGVKAVLIDDHAFSLYYRKTLYKFSCGGRVVWSNLGKDIYYDNEVSVKEKK